MQLAQRLYEAGLIYMRTDVNLSKEQWMLLRQKSLNRMVKSSQNHEPLQIKERGSSRSA
jgi:DNA topoisomerase IA